MSKQLAKIENPLVSIVTPFFNREKFLAESIESVLAQSYASWELILIDDGSIDASREIAERFVSAHPNKIVLDAHPENANCGPSASRNLGIKQARGELIAFLDSDDVFFPNALESQVKALLAHPEAEVVCGTLECWNSWQEDKRAKDFVVSLNLEVEKLYEPPFLFVHNLLAGGRKPGIGCVMLRRELLQSIDGFEASFRRANEDQVFWAKVSLNARIYVIDACLTRYRQHQDSACAITIAKDYKETENWILYFDWLAKYLEQQQIFDSNVQAAIETFRAEVVWQDKYRWLKRYYRRVLPLRTRYWLRDQWTQFKNKTRR